MDGWSSMQGTHTHWKTRKRCLQLTRATDQWVRFDSCRWFRSCVWCCCCIHPVPACLFCVSERVRGSMIHRRSELCAAALYRETVLDSNESEMEQKKIRRGGAPAGLGWAGQWCRQPARRFLFPGRPFWLGSRIAKTSLSMALAMAPLQVELFGQKPPSSSDPLTLSLSQSQTGRDRERAFALLMICWPLAKTAGVAVPQDPQSILPQAPIDGLFSSAKSIQIKCM
jgi:hypothetical protein